MESSWTWDQTRVACIGKCILIHCTTREVLNYSLTITHNTFLKSGLLLLEMEKWKTDSQKGEIIYQRSHNQDLLPGSLAPESTGAQTQWQVTLRLCLVQKRKSGEESGKLKKVCSDWKGQLFLSPSCLKPYKRLSSVFLDLLTFFFFLKRRIIWNFRGRVSWINVASNIKRFLYLAAPGLHCNLWDL